MKTHNYSCVGRWVGGSISRSGGSELPAPTVKNRSLFVLLSGEPMERSKSLTYKGSKSILLISRHADHQATASMLLFHVQHLGL